MAGIVTKPTTYIMEERTECYSVQFQNAKINVMLSYFTLVYGKENINKER